MDRKELIVKMGDHCQEHPKARRNLQPFLATKHSGMALSNIIQLLFITKPILPGKFLLSVHIFNFFCPKQTSQINIMPLIRILLLFSN